MLFSKIMIDPDFDYHNIVSIDPVLLTEDMTEGKEEIRTQESSQRLSRLALEFRERMTETVGPDDAGDAFVYTYSDYRKSFYQDVMTEANKVCVEYFQHFNLWLLIAP